MPFSASSPVGCDECFVWSFRTSIPLPAVAPADCSIPKPSHYPFEQWHLLPCSDSWCRLLWAAPRWWPVPYWGCSEVTLGYRGLTHAASWSATPPGSIPSILVELPAAAGGTLRPRWTAKAWSGPGSWGMCWCWTTARSMILRVGPRWFWALRTSCCSFRWCSWWTWTLHHFLCLECAVGCAVGFSRRKKNKIYVPPKQGKINSPASLYL